MVALDNAGHALDAGLAEIRRQLDVPASFPPEVLAAAEDAAKRFPVDRPDRTDLPFVTLDPAASTDLDQAFTIDDALGVGGDVVLRYAIADVAWFVHDGDPVDAEAWRRGTTTYLPDGKAGLYPPVLAEGAASLLPDGPRPAIVLTVRVDNAGTATLDGAELAIIRSRAKLAYQTVTPDELPVQFEELSRRVAAAEDARGAARVEPPEQVVEPDDGGYRLRLRPRLESEERNAAMSLSANIAVAGTLLGARTGLFRTMAAPDDGAVRRLRHTANALGVRWPAGETLEQLIRRLDGSKPADAAFMTAERRAGGGARYEPYLEGVVPWHAAVAATYAHATAPLRRLADRYVLEATVAVVGGSPVPAPVAAAFERLPDVMRRADARAAQVEREVVDLAEAVVLHGSEGRTFTAVVTDVDDRGARIQLSDRAVVARVDARGVQPGDALRVRLVAADPVRRTVTFERVA